MVRRRRVSSMKVAMLMCVFTAVVVAQVPDTMWTKLYGDGTYQTGYSVRPTFDGGYIIAGETGYQAGQTPCNVWLLKTNENGDTTWTKTYGGAEDDCAYDVIQTSDSGYAVIGYTFSYGTGPYYEDIWFLKTDANGDTVWVHTIDGGPTYSMADQGSSVRQTIDGGYIISGYTCSGSGIADVFLAKTDAAGTVEWTRTYGIWNRSEFGIEVEQTFDGGYIIGGFSHQFGSDYQVWILKTDSAGDTTWTKNYSSVGYNDCYSIQQTSDSGYIFTGETSDGAGNGDIWLFKLDNTGDSVWAKTYGGTENDYGLAVRQTADNGYIFTGQTSSFGSGLSNLCLLKADENGDTLWTRVWGGNWREVGSSLEQTSDLGYIITGHCQINSYNYDLWLLKIQPDLSITENEITHPKEFSTISIHPNPFHSGTQIRYMIKDPLSANEYIMINIYDVCGRLIKSFNPTQIAVNQESSIYWNGTDYKNTQVASGVYFVEFSAGDYTTSNKVLLIR